MNFEQKPQEAQEARTFVERPDGSVEDVTDRSMEEVQEENREYNN